MWTIFKPPVVNVRTSTFPPSHKIEKSLPNYTEIRSGKDNIFLFLIRKYIYVGSKPLPFIIAATADGEIL